MVRLVGEDLVRAEELLQQDHPREQVRERHRAERDPLVGPLERRAERAADHEADVAPGLPAALDPACERLGAVAAATRVEQADPGALRDPARDLLVLAQLDDLDARLARQQPLVVGEVVGVRRPRAADGQHRPLHERPRSTASAWPIRSIVLGCVPSRKRTSAGGSGSATFCTAIRRWKPISASGSPVSSIAKRSARASTARESWLEIVPTAGASSASASATAGTAAGPRSCPAGVSRSARRAAASIPNGATTTRNSSPRGTSRSCWWPSSWATTSRTSAGVKSRSSVS